MEVRCPSCGAQHRSEDYPGAFDILCGCGYLILNPELSSESADYNEINFEGPPAASEESSVAIPVQPADDELINHPVEEQPYTAENLTPPEDLPEGMLYDPAEVPQTNPAFVPEKEMEVSQIFVERIQKASLGQILGPDYDLEFSELSPESRLKARERVQKFLQDHKWLREVMERRSFLLDSVFQNEKIENVPEALAVEIYIACLENGGKCLFIRH